VSVRGGFVRCLGGFCPGSVRIEQICPDICPAFCPVLACLDFVRLGYPSSREGKLVHAPLRQRYARVRANPAPMDIAGCPIRVIPSNRPSSIDITQDEPLFRRIQAGLHASLSVARARWTDDPDLWPAPPEALKETRPCSTTLQRMS
jgi:hypothetical protein